MCFCSLSVNKRIPPTLSWNLSVRVCQNGLPTTSGWHLDRARMSKSLLGYRLQVAEEESVLGDVDTIWCQAYGAGSSYHASIFLSLLIRPCKYVLDWHRPMSEPELVLYLPMYLFSLPDHWQPRCQRKCLKALDGSPHCAGSQAALAPALHRTLHLRRA